MTSSSKIPSHVAQFIMLWTVCKGMLQASLRTITTTLIYIFPHLIPAKKSTEYNHCHYTELVYFNHYYDLCKILFKNDDWFFRIFTGPGTSPKRKFCIFYFFFYSSHFLYSLKLNSKNISERYSNQGGPLCSMWNFSWHSKWNANI